MDEREVKPHIPKLIGQAALESIHGIENLIGRFLGESQVYLGLVGAH